MEREHPPIDVATAALSTVERHGLLTSGTPVVVLVSGGGDSIALLHLLVSAALPSAFLRVLHVNHMLRGDESEADEAFVRSLCADLDVECHVVRHDVAGWAAEEHLNIEDAGRRVRYRFAESECDALCDERGVRRSLGRIATAHTRDDRVETLIMRLVSGAGAGALASIAASRGRIVRPLIDVDRVAVRVYLTHSGHEWREDSSNADTTRARAHVRERVMPELERLNPAFRANVARGLDLLAADDELLTSMADAFVRDFCRIAADVRVEFDRDLMSTLDRTMARRTVRAAVFRAFPDASRLEAAHVERIVDALADGGARFDLPGGLEVTGEYATLVVSHGGQEPPRVAPCLLPVPGSVDLGPGGVMHARLVDPSDASGTDDSVVIDADLLADELVVDSAREGDRMQPLGMAGRRKLSDMLVDAKVPRRLRGAVPVVRDDEDIVWLAGVRMSDAYRVRESTRRAVRLSWDPREDSWDEADGRTGE